MSDTTDRAVDVARRHWARTNSTRGSSWEGMSSHRQDLLTHRMAGVIEALRAGGLLATPERDAEQRRTGAVEALREAADTVDNQACADGATCHEADAAVLRIRARRIEEQR